MPHKWPHADVYRNPPSYTDLGLVNFWKHVYEGVKGEAKQVRPGVMVFFPARQTLNPRTHITVMHNENAKNEIQVNLNKFAHGSMGFQPGIYGYGEYAYPSINCLCIFPTPHYRLQVVGVPGDCRHGHQSQGFNAHVYIFNRQTSLNLCTKNGRKIIKNKEKVPGVAGGRAAAIMKRLTAVPGLYSASGQ